MKIILKTQKKNVDFIISWIKNSDFETINEPKLIFVKAKSWREWDDYDFLVHKTGIQDMEREIRISVEVSDSQKDFFMQSIVNLNLGIEIKEKIELNIKGKIDIEKYYKKEKELYVSNIKTNKEYKEDLFDKLMDDPDYSYDTFGE